jgi:hypothetical protein
MKMYGGVEVIRQQTEDSTINTFCPSLIMSKELTYEEDKSDMDEQAWKQFPSALLSVKLNLGPVESEGF